MNMNYYTYMKNKSENQLGRNNTKELKRMSEIFDKVYELETLSKNKLNKLEVKRKNKDTKAAIYINDEDYTERQKIGKKIEKVRKFCAKAKIEIVKEYIDCSLVNNYRKKDLKNIIIDSISGEFNTVIVLNSKDIGENNSINTYIINEVFTKNNIRFIDIEQKVDTNLDETLVAYENPIYRNLMSFIENEEKRIRSETIKKAKK